jgi:DNA end-binding protein Ku
VRAIWKGAVSFGLVNVPVRLYSATENHDVQFRQVHRTDGGRIRYQRVCSIDGEQVAYDDIAKGYETDDGQMVVLTDEDLAQLPVSSSREIAVEKFVPADQIDPLLLEKSYYLEPDKAAAKPYALLRDALKAADRMAIVTVSIRTRMTVAVLRVRDDVIVMQTMLWPDEVRSPEFANLGDAEHAAKPAELKMANMLVESLAGDYDPDDYEDDYEQAVEAVVKAKLEGGEVHEVAGPAEDGSGEVVDLLAALQRSVERAKAARGEPTGGDGAAVEGKAGEDAEGTEDTEDTAPARSGTAAKTSAPARKSATRKSTAHQGTAAKQSSPARKTTAAKKSAPARKTAKKAADEAPRKKAAS